MRWFAIVATCLVLAGCQNADLLRPAGAEAAEEGEDRSFTRISPEAPGPLTSEIAFDWFDRLRAAEGQQRLELINEFFAAFPEAQRVPLVRELQAEALAAEERLQEAADAYELALALTRTDITGLPLTTDLPLQVGLNRLSAGQVDAAQEWLFRTSIGDQADRVMLGLQWSYSNHTDSALSFEDWVRAGREDVAAIAPPFQLPGLLTESVALDPGSTVTLINFWSPT